MSQVQVREVYAALAAASWYTCIEDLALFLKANVSPNPVLSYETIELMNKIHAQSGSRMHGLGPMIFAKNGAGDKIVGHDGVNRAAINNAARYNVRTKDGIIVLAVGHLGIASTLADEWGYWKTGMPNSTVMQSNLKRILTWLISGYLMIAASFIYFISR